MVVLLRRVGFVEWDCGRMGLGLGRRRGSRCLPPLFGRGEKSQKSEMDVFLEVGFQRCERVFFGRGGFFVRILFTLFLFLFWFVVMGVGVVCGYAKGPWFFFNWEPGLRIVTTFDDSVYILYKACAVQR